MESPPIHLAQRGFECGPQIWTNGAQACPGVATTQQSAVSLGWVPGPVRKR